MIRLIEYKNIAAITGRNGPMPTALPLMGGVQFPPDAPDWCFNLRGLPPGRLHGGRPPREEVPQDREHLSGTYVYGGFLHWHFGHMISEFMHRLWPLERPELQDARPVFIDMLNRRGEKLLRDVLSLMNLPEPLIVDRPVEFEKLVVGEPGRWLYGTTMPGYNDFLERRLGYLRGPREPRPARLSVLRGHLGKSRCLGERWLERELVRHGYSIFHPEEHSVREQMEHYLDAEKIIFSEGSAIHLVDIMPVLKADVMVLNRRAPGILAQTTLTGKCASLQMFDGYPMRGLQDPISVGLNGLSWVDMPSFVCYLKEQNFISEMPTVSFFDDPDLILEDLEGYLDPQSAKLGSGGDPANMKQMLKFLVRGMGMIMEKVDPKSRAIAARRAAAKARCDEATPDR